MSAAEAIAEEILPRIVGDAVESLQSASDWSRRPVDERLAFCGRLPAVLAARESELLAAIKNSGRENLRRRSAADTISSEIMPLATAARWHAKHARRVLRPRRIRHRGSDPFIGRLRGRIERVPLGTVLIISTWNYPIYLAMATALQALVAGNRVIIKPAPGCEAVAEASIECFYASGIPEDALRIVGSDVSVVEPLLAGGVSLLHFTGSAATGRKIAELAGRHGVPMIAELSGCDCLVVLPGADLARVASAVAFGLRLNGGCTCMAPRRLIIDDPSADRLLPLIGERLKDLAAAAVDRPVAEKICDAAAEAVERGAEMVSGQIDRTVGSQASVAFLPLILDRVLPDAAIAQDDYFAPVLSIHRLPARNVKEWTTEAVSLINDGQYALSASVFGPPTLAWEVAKRLDVGVVTINDIIAPTVEPTISFGGRRMSGWGRSRGEEGLRQLTTELAIVERRGNFLPHLQTPQAIHDTILSGLLQFRFAQSWRRRLAGFRQLIGGSRRVSR